MKRDMYVIAAADPEGTMQRNVSYESFLQDDVDRSSSFLLTPVNIFLHGAGLLSTFSLNSVSLDLASLQPTTEVDEMIVLSLSRTLLASFVPMIIRRTYS